jgi:hypothetical protein
MEIKKNSWALVLVGMTLGTAWAIRGQFGHEQGAAWAGAIGSLAVLILTKRKDWIAKGLIATFAGAAGWGLGGMMSYGILVGHGKSDDFYTAYYSFSTLFLIGGLYGFMGGGLFGAVLSDTKKNPVNWNQLLLEMTAGGILFYFFMVEQLGIFLNPPRSEVWAVCLGIGAAIYWHLYRNNHHAALRVALYAGIGGGFGFGFGNFLQVIGWVLNISFNFWNVMEYSLGFFGGVGLCYGVLTGKWEEEEEEETGLPVRQMFQLFMISLLIPLIVWQQSFEWNRIQETYSPLLGGDDPTVSFLVRFVPLILILTVAAFWMIKYNKKGITERTEIQKFFFSHWFLYLLLSLIITGALRSTYRIEQYLYVANYLIVVLFIGKSTLVFQPTEFNLGPPVTILFVVMSVLGIAAWVAIQIH